MTTNKIALVTFALSLTSLLSAQAVEKPFAFRMTPSGIMETMPAPANCAGQLISEPDGRLSIRSWEGRCIIDQIEASKVLSICEVGSDCGVLAACRT
jgi:hypothetical protein